MVKTAPMTFDQLLRKLPRCIGGLDFARHKTAADLAYLVQTEMDMYNEGEPEADIKNERQYIAAAKFIELCKLSTEK